jgi:hypothetical protein
MSSENIREMLVSYYSKHNPSCANSVDTILSTYKGREEQLLKVLAAKYGPDPLLESSQRTQKHSLPMGIEERVRRFYRAYNPDKIDSVPLILKAFEGQLDTLIPHLERKYGPEPKLDLIDTQIKSPSPPQLSAHTECHLSSRLEHPCANDTGRGTKYDEIITKLTSALDQKTVEVLKLKEELEKARGGTEQLRKEFQGVSEELQSLRINYSELQRSNAESKSVIASLESQLADEKTKQNDDRKTVEELKKNSDILRSAVAIREHQVRLLHIELQQSVNELVQKENLIAEGFAMREKLETKICDLIKEVSALRLHSTEPGSELKFYRVVEEIQSSFAAYYSQRQTSIESEMQKYYEYAKLQIDNRDAIINELRNQCFGKDVCALASTPDCAKSTKDEESLADEVARLQIQLSVQSSELKSLVEFKRGTLEPFSSGDRKHSDIETFLKSNSTSSQKQMEERRELFRGDMWRAVQSL